jgi:hypothetical protein
MKTRDAVHEMYLNKYGTVAPHYDYEDTVKFRHHTWQATYQETLKLCCYKVVDMGAGVAEMAMVYDVDEQQLYDLVQCQRAHHQWADSL